MSGINTWKDIEINVDDDFSQDENLARVKVQFSIEDENQNTTITLKLIRKDRWKIYDLEYQSISIIDIERVGYDSKIKRIGVENLIKICLQSKS